MFIGKNLKVFVVDDDLSHIVSDDLKKVGISKKKDRKFVVKKMKKLVKNYHSSSKSDLLQITNRCI